MFKKGTVFIHLVVVAIELAQVIVLNCQAFAPSIRLNTSRRCKFFMNSAERNQFVHEKDRLFPIDYSNSRSRTSESTRRESFGGLCNLWIAANVLLGSKKAVAQELPFIVELEIQLDPRDEKSSNIEIEVYPEMAPLAAARFRELVEIGFYDEAKFFRVLPGYIAQFGIASNADFNKEWILCEKSCRSISDEKRKLSNKKGTLSFASSGKDSRQTQVFINLSNNDGPPNFLDAQGFVPFAKVISGMDTVVPKLNTEYGLIEELSGGLSGAVNQRKAAYYGKEYLDALFPKLSVLKKATIKL
mmetsp:Transcript_7206/g.10325  ORF Transcript_7206/g.10325 Transcript_7206/m.10325 type:complete len:301 (-) Transcript_7206:83-985(-)